MLNQLDLGFLWFPGHTQPAPDDKQTHQKSVGSGRGYDLLLLGRLLCAGHYLLRAHTTRSPFDRRGPETRGGAGTLPGPRSWDSNLALTPSLCPGSPSRALPVPGALSLATRDTWAWGGHGAPWEAPAREEEAWAWPGLAPWEGAYGTTEDHLQASGAAWPQRGWRVGRLGTWVSGAGGWPGPRAPAWGAPCI